LIFRAAVGGLALAVLAAFGAAMPEDATPTEALLSGCGLALLAFGGVFAGMQVRLAAGADAAASEGADEDRDGQGEPRHQHGAVRDVVD
jgi:hypothetical protein